MHDSMWDQAARIKPADQEINGVIVKPTAFSSVITIGSAAVGKIEWRYIVPTEDGTYLTLAPLELYAYKECEKIWAVEEGAPLPVLN